MFSRILSRRTKAAAIIALLASSVLAPVAASADAPCYIVDSTDVAKIFDGRLCSGALTIGSDITTIGAGAFVGNSDITEVVIPNTVSAIEDEGFARMGSLVSVEFIEGEGGLTIGASAFEDASALTNLVIPTRVTSIGSSAFAYASALTTLTFKDEQNAAELHVESSAFYQASNLVSLVIPHRVNVLPFRAFANTFSLKNLTIPTSVTEIGDSAFDLGADHNSLLTEIRIPDTVTSIGGYAFRARNSRAQAITLGSGLETIGTGAFSFEGAALYKSLVIPNSVTEIGNEAFKNSRSKLSLLTLGSGLVSIGFEAFRTEGPSLISNLVFPASLTTIEGGAFSAYSQSWKKLRIPETMATIGSYAFEAQQSSSLERLKFDVAPAGVNRVLHLGPGAFRNSTSLKSLTIPSQVIFDVMNLNDPDSDALLTNDYGIQFENSWQLEHLEIEEGVSSIPWGAFSESFSLTEITIPASVTHIGSFAFKNTRSMLEKVRFSKFRPQSEIEILDGAFNDGDIGNMYQTSTLQCLTLPEVDLIDILDQEVFWVDAGIAYVRGDQYTLQTPECEDPEVFPAEEPWDPIDSGSTGTTGSSSVVYVTTPTEVVDVPESHQSSVFFAKGKASLDLNSKTSIQTFAKTFAKATAVKILVTSYRVGASSNKKEVALARARGTAVVAYFKARRIDATYQLLPSIRVKTATLASRVAISVSAVMKVTRAKTQ